MGTQESHIKELLVWIEDNLTNPLSLDIVAAKSGYTKWYLQRMFKKQTGLSLASYIRARRLYLAAFALRFTQKSILDISVEYPVRQPADVLALFQETLRRIAQRVSPCPQAGLQQSGAFAGGQPARRYSG